jgi:hypothetical protein
MRLFVKPVLLLLLLLVAASTQARNLDLATVPDRQSVQLTIYNSEDLTLVRESRVVSFREGDNPLQFSWANTLIDPTSVELSFPGAEQRLRILDTTFPHDKPQMLYWTVHADADLETRIEISYFTSGIRWDADYLALADPTEERMRLQGFVRVTNHSGEDYGNAAIRLVVGEINLVEQIAELARVPVGRLNELARDEYRQLRQHAARKAMAMPAPAVAEGAMMGLAGAVPEPKQIEKEGLGEYFIYSIEGTETVPTGWSKRLRSFDAPDVPIQVEYRYRQPEYGDQLVRLYLLRNDTESNLGRTPIPNGRIQVLRENGRGGVTHLAGLQIKYVPIGDRLELNLGRDPEVIFELVKQRVARDNIWVRLHKARIYKRVDDSHLQVDHRAKVEGWDEHQDYVQRIRNYTDKPIRVEVRRSFFGDVRFVSRLDPKLHDFRTVQYQTEVPAGGRKALSYRVTTAQGYNSKQDRVVLVGE